MKEVSSIENKRMGCIAHASFCTHTVNSISREIHMSSLRILKHLRATSSFPFNTKRKSYGQVFGQYIICRILI